MKEEELRQINHEVLIGIGSEDKMVSFAESERVSELLPNGKLNRLIGFEHPIDKIEPLELLLFIEESFK